MHLSSSVKDIDSKGSTTNRSLSSSLAWVARCNCYFESWVRGSDCRSFCFSHALVVTIGSTIELLVGCSGGQFSLQWSDS